MGGNPAGVDDTGVEEMDDHGGAAKNDGAGEVKVVEELVGWRR